MSESSQVIAELQDEVLKGDSKALWVFGYGSLCWRPGFNFHKAVTGFVQGYSRRFWQGNTTHRGTEENPGRVATLVENTRDIVHGVAYAISGEDALPYLAQRECTLGEYVTKFMNFHPVQGEPFSVLVYVATSKNKLWLGEADTSEIARQIVHCKGSSGHNVEYIVRLANFMRQHFPDQEDDHLYSLEKEILSIVEQKGLSLRTMMGDGQGCISFIRRSALESNDNSRPQHDEERTDTFEHSARIPEKQLRCLNI